MTHHDIEKWSISKLFLPFFIDKNHEHHFNEDDEKRKLDFLSLPINVIFISNTLPPSLSIKLKRKNIIWRNQ